MRFDQFRDRLQEALAGVGLFSATMDILSEAVELTTMERRWRVAIWRSAPRQVEPFHASASISFRWNPFNAARSFTCEEDLLTEIYGERKRPATTEPRMVRVDVTLRARLPYGASAAMPAPSLLGAWTATLNEALAHCLPHEMEDSARGHGALIGGREDVRIEARCSEQGVLLLDGVSVSLFRLVRVPRVWDDPSRREREAGIEDELAEFAARMKAGIDDWTDGIAELATWMQHVPHTGPVGHESAWDLDDDDPDIRH